jgi:hypothetical protein
MIHIRLEPILPALIFVAAIGSSAAIGSPVSPAIGWWQFVANGPNGERQVSPHFKTEKECKNALKATEVRLAKIYPDLYPLVGSCEEYR